jgi:hypothetical protein
MLEPDPRTPAMPVFVPLVSPENATLPPLLPLAAAVRLPSAATVIFAFVYDPGVTAVAAIAECGIDVAEMLAPLITGGDKNVWIPVKVCAESVRAMVAFVDGNVIVVRSVPASVIVFDTVSTLALAIVSVPVVVVIVRPFMVPGMISPEGSAIVQVTVVVPVQVPVAVI